MATRKTKKTHRSIFLKDIRDTIPSLSVPIRQARNDLGKEITATYQHFESVCKDRNWQDASRLLFLISYHLNMGNDLIVENLIQNFALPLHERSFPTLEEKNGIESKAVESFSSIDLESLRSSIVSWEGDHKDDQKAKLKGLLLRVEDMGQGAWWTVYDQYNDYIPDAEDQPLARDVSVARRLAEEVARKHLNLAERAPTRPTSFDSLADMLGVTVLDGRLRAVSLRHDGTYRFTDGDLNLEMPLADFGSLLAIYSSENTRLLEAIEEFEYLINGNAIREAALQDFFIRNPDFIIGDEYKAAHSQVVLTPFDDREPKLIPDFVLEPYSPNSLCDILEIKRPSAKVVTLRQSRARFSSAVSEACAQAREYGSFFDSSQHQKAIRERYGLEIYKPRLFVVIGRRPLIDQKLLRRIEEGNPGVNVKTYDDLLERMQRRSGV